MERDQKKIQDDLSSNSRARIRRGQKAAQKYEDKYGQSVSDDVREFSGFDKNTGKPIAAKVGKYADFSEKAFAIAAKQGAINNTGAARTFRDNNTRVVSPGRVVVPETVVAAGQAPTPTTTIASAVPFSERNDQTRTSIPSAKSFSERLAGAKQAPASTTKQRAAEYNKQPDDNMNIASKVAEGVTSLASIDTAIKTLVNKIIELDKNTKGSISRLSKR